jgi:serine protease Do
LLGTARPSPSWHGLSLQTLVSPDKARVLVKGVEPQSPAEETGLQPGDEITAIDGQDVVRALDVQRVLLGRKPGEEVSLSLVRNEAPLTLPLTLADARPATVDGQARIWETLGLRLDPVPAAQFQQLRSRYRGGLTVVDVRPEGPAHRQGIRRGDVLVGMHVWETVSMENVTYILDRPDFTQLDPLKFYILRGTETLYGHLSVARRAR